jgi:hypothetical protein
MNPKLCKTCKSKFTPDRQFQQTCSFDCAIGLVKFNQAKKAKKDWVKEKAERKEKIMTKPDWEKRLQYYINQIIHSIDKNVPCIATGATTGKRNAGHRFSIGSTIPLRYNLHNIHIQSEHSNNFKGGDNDRYDDGLIKVYGQEYRDYIHTLRQTKPLHLTVETLKEKIVIAKLIKNELVELGNTYSAAERIILRYELNRRLGIYLERL